MRRQSRRVPFGGITVSILSPEHLAVCKAMFDRRKDWIDIEDMVIAGDELDLPQIEEWLVRMVGDSDKRVEQLRALGGIGETRVCGWRAPDQAGQGRREAE
jgi:hypothetical protein